MCTVFFVMITRIVIYCLYSITVRAYFRFLPISQKVALSYICRKADKISRRNSLAIISICCAMDCDVHPI